MFCQLKIVPPVICFSGSKSSNFARLVQSLKIVSLSSIDTLIEKKISFRDSHFLKHSTLTLVVFLNALISPPTRISFKETQCKKGSPV
jgi:hypothetical protein